MEISSSAPKKILSGSCPASSARSSSDIRENTEGLCSVLFNTPPNSSLYTISYIDVPHLKMQKKNPLQILQKINQFFLTKKSLKTKMAGNFYFLLMIIEVWRLIKNNDRYKLWLIINLPQIKS